MDESWEAIRERVKTTHTRLNELTRVGEKTQKAVKAMRNQFNAQRVKIGEHTEIIETFKSTIEANERSLKECTRTSQTKNNSLQKQLDKVTEEAEDLELRNEQQQRLIKHLEQEKAERAGEKAKLESENKQQLRKINHQEQELQADKAELRELQADESELREHQKKADTAKVTFALKYMQELTVSFLSYYEETWREVAAKATSRLKTTGVDGANDELLALVGRAMDKVWVSGQFQANDLGALLFARFENKTDFSTHVS